jgi:hypothetical protein
VVGEGKGLEGDDDGLDRELYSRRGYFVIFAPAAVVMLGAAGVLLPMRRRLERLREIKEGGEALLRGGEDEEPRTADRESGSGELKDPLLSFRN